jgi:hypothetical protein
MSDRTAPPHVLWFGSAFEFHDLEGSGAAARVPRLVEILDNYASQAFVIVDNEGDMAAVPSPGRRRGSALTVTSSRWSAL